MRCMIPLWSEAAVPECLLSRRYQGLPPPVR